LIFLQATFVEWFSVKLVLVGILAGLHVQAGLLVLRVFDADGQFSRGGALSMTGGTLATVAGVLLVVLWKPQVDAEALAPGLFSPGQLSELLAPVIAWVTP
jgi:protoporphyrinogen IX oxidase